MPTIPARIIACTCGKSHFYNGLIQPQTVCSCGQNLWTLTHIISD